MKDWRIKSREDLYRILCIESIELDEVLRYKSQDYIPYEIVKHQPKKTNKRNRSATHKEVRTIHALRSNSRLKNLQNNLNNNYFIKNIQFPDCVYGFLRGKSYEDFLFEHISRNKSLVYFRLDILDFFGSIRYKDLRKELSYYIAEEPECSSFEHSKILDLLCDIVTLNNQVVQGAVTSPLISNLVFRSLDIRIMRYCQCLGIRYTRYADDLLFSFEKKNVLDYYKCDNQADDQEVRNYINSYIDRIVKKIAAIISDKGFMLNYSKTVRGTGELSLNGFVISNEVRLARKKQHKLNKLLYQCNLQLNVKSRNKLAGFRSFYIQMLRYATQPKTQKLLQHKISCIEKIIDSINDTSPIDSQQT